MEDRWVTEVDAYKAGPFDYIGSRDIILSRVLLRNPFLANQDVPHFEI